MKLPFFIETDAKGAEWVIVAFESDDEKMKEVVRKRQDPHAMTAHYMTGLPVELIIAEDKLLGKEKNRDKLIKGREKLAKTYPEILKADWLPETETLRQGSGKKTNHGLNYGEGSEAYAEQYGLPFKTADWLRNRYLYEVYSNVPLWWDRLMAQAKAPSKQGYACRSLFNCFGRKLVFLGPISGPAAWKTNKQMAAAIPQSTVHDIIMGAETVVLEEIPHAQLLSDNHDSILTQHFVDSDKDISNNLTRLFSEVLRIKQAFEIELTSPFGEIYNLESEMKYGFNWGEGEGEGGKDNPNGLIDLPMDINGLNLAITRTIAFWKANL